MKIIWNFFRIEHCILDQPKIVSKSSSLMHSLVSTIVEMSTIQGYITSIGKQLMLKVTGATCRPTI